MDISIQKVMNQGTEQWLVCAGSIIVYFRDQQSALEFSSQLKERVEAPHLLPSAEHQVLVKEMQFESV
ncbi:hypothetical protein ACT048_16405 [Ectopseudomonas khazarica]|uniref:hypothetical protein n=1 Tax=Ectopseudomonas khazarica TaxID=2502979 RepID=UPI004034C256